MSKTNVKIITLKPILTKEEINEKEGHYFPESHYTKYNNIVNTNTDVYGIEED